MELGYPFLGNDAEIYNCMENGGFGKVSDAHIT